MRLANGITVDKEATFGELKFSALRTERFEVDENGELTSELRHRTYDLKCKKQGCMIQVQLGAEVGLKEYDYNAEVELINPVVSAITNVSGNFATVDWYIRADDIVLKKADSKPSTPNTGKQEKPQMGAANAK